MQIKKVKYLRQKDSSSCGPIAVINAMKWLGYNVTSDFIPFCKWLCLCKDSIKTSGGTRQEDLHNAIKFLELKNTLIKHSGKNIKKINDHLDANGSVLLIYSFYEGKERDPDSKNVHAALIIKKSKRYYTIVNDSVSDTVCKRSIKKVTKAIMDDEGCQYYTWLIQQCAKEGKLDAKKTKHFFRTAMNVLKNNGCFAWLIKKF